MSSLVLRTPHSLFRLFDESFGGNSALESFRVNVNRNEDTYVFKAELPGVPREAIEVDVDQHHVTIRVKQEKQQQESRSYWSEFTTSNNASRSFKVDDALNTESANVDLQHGILTISVDRASKGQRRTLKLS